MKIGLALPHYGDATLDSVVGVAGEAERLGFDSVWVSDHLVFDLEKYGGTDEPIGCLEPLSTLAVLAAETERVRLGTMVLCNEFRHPAVVAKQAAVIQQASGGRLELGLGAGWYEREFDTFGIEFPPPGVRLRHLAESVTVIRRSFEGEPVPLHAPAPTIWVGGKGDRAIALAARVGDGWNAAWFQDPQAYSERAVHLRDAGVRRSIGQYAQGSASEQVDRLQAFAALGVEHAVMCFSSVPFGLDDPDDVARFASDVLPHVRDA